MHFVIEDEPCQPYNFNQIEAEAFSLAVSRIRFTKE